MFNPRIWLRDAIRAWPETRRAFIEWLDAPSLRERVRQQEKALAELEKGLKGGFQVLSLEIEKIDGQTRRLARRLEALEKAAERGVPDEGRELLRGRA